MTTAPLPPSGQKAVKLTKAQRAVLDELHRGVFVFDERKLRGAKLTAMNKVLTNLMRADLIEHAGYFYTYRLTDAGRSAMTPASSTQQKKE